MSDEFLNEGMEVVHKCAGKIWKTLPSHLKGFVERGDLEHWGFIGLCTAMRRFNPSFGHPFSHYAYGVIMGSIMDELATVTEASSRAGQEKRDMKFISLESIKFHQAFQTPMHLHHTESVENKEQFRIILEGVKSLPFLDQVVIRLYFWDDNRMATIGEKLSVSRTTVSTLLGNALDKLESYVIRRMQ